VGSAALCFCLDTRPQIARKKVQARSTVRIEHHANKKNLTLDTITRKNILRYARKTQDMFLDDCRKAMLG